MPGHDGNSTRRHPVQRARENRNFRGLSGREATGSVLGAGPPAETPMHGGRGSGSRYDRGMILLLRHGEAEPDQGDGDAARRLTPKGEAQAMSAGRAIARLELKVDLCLTSPKVRARDTATLACGALEIDPEISEPIGSGDFDTLDLVAGRGNVMLVGHEPDLSMEVARLTGAEIKLKKGGLAGLDRGVLRLLLRPTELTAVAGA